MDSREFAALEDRITARARQMWEDAGCPDGGPERYTDQARELVAIAENPGSGRFDPEKAAEPVVEPLAAVENQGEFPGLTDQGEDLLFPDEQDTVEAPITRK